MHVIRKVNLELLSNKINSSKNTSLIPIGASTNASVTLKVRTNRTNDNLSKKKTNDHKQVYMWDHHCAHHIRHYDTFFLWKYVWRARIWIARRCCVSPLETLKRLGNIVVSTSKYAINSSYDGQVLSIFTLQPYISKHVLSSFFGNVGVYGAMKM